MNLLRVGVVVVLVVACGTMDPATTSTTTTVPTPPTSTPDSTQARVDLALGDLAGRLSIDPDRIEVVSVDEVTWSDGSIGCPEPGGLYTQALVPGYRIILAVDGVEYPYHGARTGGPFLCENDPLPPVPGDS